MFGKLVVLLATISLSLGQIVAPGPCPEVQPVENFDINILFGKWFELKRYEVEAISGLDCVDGIYSPWNDTHLAIESNAKNFTNNGEVLHFTGSMREEYPGQNLGVFHLLIDGQPLEEILYLLHIDGQVSLSWTCFYFEEFQTNYQFLWIHGKERTLTSEQAATIDEVMHRYGLDINMLRDTIQDPEVCTFD